MATPTLTPPNKELEELEQLLLQTEPAKRRRDWFLVAIGLTALLSVIGLLVGLFALAGDQAGAHGQTQTIGKQAAASTTGPAAAPTLAQAKGIRFEPFKPVDATLPAVPAGQVKKFHVVVFQ